MCKLHYTYCKSVRCYKDGYLVIYVLHLDISCLKGSFCIHLVSLFQFDYLLFINGHSELENRLLARFDAASQKRELSTMAECAKILSQVTGFAFTWPVMSFHNHDEISIQAEDQTITLTQKISIISTFVFLIFFDKLGDAIYCPTHRFCAFVKISYNVS